MTTALSPDLALAYVRELSADVVAGVVLARNGAVLAGEPDLAPAAVAFGAALGDATDAAVTADAGVVVGARTSAHTLLVVLTGRAFPGPTKLDVRAAIEALDGAQTAPQRGIDAPSAPLRVAAEAALNATSHRFAPQ